MYNIRPNYIKLFTGFIQEIYYKKSIIYELAKRDYQVQYKGSYLGFFWTYIQPLLFILIIWGVLSIGFRLQNIENTSHAYWLICGMIVWLYFSEVFIAMTSVIQQFNFLIKKVDFSLGILPLVKIFSALINHLVFIFLTIVLGCFYSVFPSIFTLQIIYYIFSMVVLLIGLGWITSSTSVFVKDVNNIVSILIQFGFWLTPIFWSISMIPQKYHWMVKVNPVYYIVSGYRDTLIYKIPFWEKPLELIYFWGTVSIILVIGAIVFRRLRPHFAEVI
ncbi:MAG: ABC transporter permease [Ignavibacteriales bacterium]|nr:ABC transporter permease [Ignavibacteriales bacterium]